MAPATGVARSQFARRASGATTGVTRSGGQAVFASAAAQGKLPRAKGAASGLSPSAGSASGDLWGNFKPQARSSVFAAESAAGKQGGGGAVPAALLVLGLGLAGLVGSASVLGLRRRKVRATGSATTEM